MEPKLILRSFSAFGLNTYEAKSYLSLLEKDRVSAVEVAKLSGVPRGRVYEILDNLLAKGLCHSIPGKVKYYRAVNPTILREKMASKLRTVESEIHQKKQELSSLRNNTDEIIESLVPLYDESRKKNSPMDYIEIIKDSHQVHKRFIELIGTARSEILVFTKPPYTGPRKVLEEQTESQVEMIRQGVTNKSIYEIPEKNADLEWWYNDIDKAARAGEEARVIKELPMKMVIIDGKIVMLPLKDAYSASISFTTQVIEHTSLAQGLKILFNTLWEQAEDYHVLEDLLKRM